MKFLIVAALIAVAAADSVYPRPAYPSYSAPAYPAKTYDYPAQPYNFNWAVKDDPSYNDYAHSESSDGKTVSGSYRVLLPDGRTQTVTYKDEGYGYVADVQYSGEYKSYDYKPAYKPAYKSAYPATYPAPAYPTPSYPTPSYPAPAYPTKY